MHQRIALIDIWKVLEKTKPPLYGKVNLVKSELSPTLNCTKKSVNFQMFSKLKALRKEIELLFICPWFLRLP